jgi:hypothetical protein
LLKFDIKLRFYFRQRADFVVANGTAQSFSGTIQLACTYTELPRPLLDLYTSAKNPFTFIDYEYTEFNIGWAGGSTQYIMQVPGLAQKDIVTLNYVDRNSADIGTPLACTYDNYNALASYNLKVNSLYVCNTQFDITPSYNNAVVFSFNNFPGQIVMSGLNIYPITYSADIEGELENSSNHYTGSRRFDSTDINATFNYSASVANARTLTICCQAFRRLALDVRAGVIKILPQ